MLDLDAYNWARAELTSPADAAIVFCGANTRWLTDDWLEKIVAAFNDPTVGMVASGGSYESLMQSFTLRDRLLYRFRFAGAPNPHLRTNVFAFAPAALALLRWNRAGSKIGAWALENGRRSFYRQIVKAGLRGVVVGADGNYADESEWPGSGTWRSGDQHNLIASDQRSDEYLAADAEERARLRKLSWG
jgi:hypothetical protein